MHSWLNLYLTNINGFTLPHVYDNIGEIKIVCLVGFWTSLTYADFVSCDFILYSFTLTGTLLIKILGVNSHLTEITYVGI